MHIENIDSCGVYTQHQDRERLKPHLHALKRSALHAKFLAPVPRLPVPRLAPGGSLGTPKILSTGATLHVGPIPLQVENWGYYLVLRCTNLC